MGSATSGARLRPARTRTGPSRGRTGPVVEISNRVEVALRSLQRVARARRAASGDRRTGAALCLSLLLIPGRAAVRRSEPRRRYGNGEILFETLDIHTVAMTMAPLVVNGEILSGSSGEVGVRGRPAARDENTGAVPWLREAGPRSAARNCRPALPLAGVLVALVLGACDDSGAVRDAAAIRASFSQIGDPEQGARHIEQRGCGACHMIPGIDGARGLVGPPLDHMGNRAYIAGLLPNTPANMVTWLRDPQAIVPGNAMPDVGLSEEQARDIAAYLYTLE